MMAYEPDRCPKPDEEDVASIARLFGPSMNIAPFGPPESDLALHSLLLAAYHHHFRSPVVHIQGEQVYSFHFYPTNE